MFYFVAALPAIACYYFLGFVMDVVTWRCLGCSVLEIVCAEDREVAEVTDIDCVVIVDLIKTKIGLSQLSIGWIPNEVVVDSTFLVLVAQLCLLSDTYQTKFVGFYLPSIHDSKLQRFFFTICCTNVIFDFVNIEFASFVL